VILLTVEAVIQI